MTDRQKEHLILSMLRAAHLNEIFVFSTDADIIKKTYSLVELFEDVKLLTYEQDHEKAFWIKFNENHPALNVLNDVARSKLKSCYPSYLSWRSMRAYNDEYDPIRFTMLHATVTDRTFLSKDIIIHLFKKLFRSENMPASAEEVELLFALEGKLIR